MRILVGLSGGVDSSVAAALLLEQGHEVVGVTLKLWGGAQDSGCCSVGDVDDARRAAQQLGVAHHVFNFTDDFERHVVDPYVVAHAEGRTPNPCVECNRHLKFDRLLERAAQLGFDAMATGHHARIVPDGNVLRVGRGADAAKDQSYVLHMLGQAQLARLALPVGELSKAEVRSKAHALGLRTAAKPESQDTCFITASGGREVFLRSRAQLHAGRVVDTTGQQVGTVDAVELVTVGQRRGLGHGGAGRRFAVAVDVAARVVTVGDQGDLLVDHVEVGPVSWSAAPLPPDTPVRVQTSAHGAPHPGVWSEGQVRFDQPQKRPAPGQAVVLYDGTTGHMVLGGGPAV